MTNARILILGAIIAFPTLASAGGLIGDLVKGATGGSVDLDKGEVCALNQCVDKNGKTRTKSRDEMVEDALGTIPGYNLLSEPDKANVRSAAKVTGVILATTTMDPITGGLVIQFLAGDKKEEVAVPSYKPNPPPTAITYTMSAACLIQRDAKSITAAFIEGNADLGKVVPGDTLSLTAPYCSGFGQSVTSVVMRATSKATPVDNTTKFKWIILGST
jgi:hypothetical protein